MAGKLQMKSTCNIYTQEGHFVTKIKQQPQPKAHTNDLHIAITESVEKRKNSTKTVTRSPDAEGLQWSNFLRVFLYVAQISVKC